MLRTGPLLLALVCFLGCSKQEQRTQTRPSDYVDSRTCSGCHAEIAKTYRSTGMARAFHRVREGDLAQTGEYFHPASGRKYEMVARDGRLFQRRTEDGGNLFELEVHYILGSGNHSRNYLHRTQHGTLVQLPLAWYAEKGGFWAMNPGFDRPDHKGFSRAVTNECLFCHNGYGSLAESSARPGDEVSFPADLAEGIDCQRCHGPGREHVASASAQKPPAQIRGAILNPKNLPRDRQMEVCMQCHLETTSRTLPYSIIRYDRGVFSYRPGEELASYILHFDHAAGKGPPDKFEIAHAAYRLRKSACFTRSESLTCTTCHDPHNIVRGIEARPHYKAACTGCHAKSHRPDEDCLSCHMPKRRTDDVVHVVMTDHYIQRKPPARDLLAPLQEQHDTPETAYRGPVVPYYPADLKDELYLAIAQVAEGSNVAEGIKQLEARVPGVKEGLVFHQLAEAYWRTGDVDRAILNYEKALKLRPGLLRAIRNLGAAHLANNDPGKAAAVLISAPNDPAAVANLGEAYRRRGELDKAITALRKAADLDPTLPEPHLWLGRAREAQGGGYNSAAEAYQQAIRIRPDYAEAHYYLGTLRASQGLRADAEKHLLRAVRHDPTLADAYNNLGNLAAQARDTVKAAGYFRKAIHAKPDLYAAHLNLGVALAELGQPAAIGHFRQAKKSGDPQVRAAAERALQLLGSF